MHCFKIDDKDYLRRLECSGDFSLLVAKVFEDVFEGNTKNKAIQLESLEDDIKTLQVTQINIKEKIKTLTSPDLIKDLEEDYDKNQQKIRENEQIKEKLSSSVDGEYKKALKYTQFLIEHPYEVVDFLEDPREIGQVFPLFFAELPSYDQLVNRTPNLSPVFKVSTMKNVTQDQLVTPRGFEPRLPG